MTLASFRRRLPIVLAAGLTLLLTGCGKGVDATLQTANANVYHPSLAKAWKDMTPDQQNAFNWAVSNISLEQLHQKYANASPRRVITDEADQYIKVQTQEAATVTAELAKNADRLAQEEATIAAARQELDKVGVVGAKIVRDSFFDRSELSFVTHNNSKYDISSAKWEAWLFLDGEKESSRKCIISGYFKYHGGLASGRSLESKQRLDSFSACESWDTLQARNARHKDFQFKLVDAEVMSFDEQPVVPRYSPTRGDYESKLASTKNNIATAMQAKAALSK